MRNAWGIVLADQSDSDVHPDPLRLSRGDCNAAAIETWMCGWLATGLDNCSRGEENLGSIMDPRGLNDVIYGDDWGGIWEDGAKRNGHQLQRGGRMRGRNGQHVREDLCRCWSSKSSRKQSDHRKKPDQSSYQGYLGCRLPTVLILFLSSATCKVSAREGACLCTVPKYHQRPATIALYTIHINNLQAEYKLTVQLSLGKRR